MSILAMTFISTHVSGTTLLKVIDKSTHMSMLGGGWVKDSKIPASEPGNTKDTI